MIIGTTNPSKVSEIASICHPYGLSLETLELSVPETGRTFRENAQLKARAYAAAKPGEVVLVEDSGLEVPALDGLPGVDSANFYLQGPNPPQLHPIQDREKIDRLNNELLLARMAQIPFQQRGARFIVQLLVVKGDQILFSTEGQSVGYIAEVPQGTHGFGYDPVFIGRDTFGYTYAELDSARKNLRSHRKQALKALDTWLSGIVKADRFHIFGQ